MSEYKFEPEIIYTLTVSKDDICEALSEYTSDPNNSPLSFIEWLIEASEVRVGKREPELIYSETFK